MNFSKCLSSIIVILFLVQGIFAQPPSPECEKIFVEEMGKIQSYLESEKLSPEEVNQYAQIKMDNMKKENPQCFPDYNPVVAKKEIEKNIAENKKAIETKKVVKKLEATKEDPKVQTEIADAYLVALKKCRDQMNFDLNSQVRKARTGAERLKMKKEMKLKNDQKIHDCAMEKLATKL